MCHMAGPFRKGTRPKYHEGKVREGGEGWGSQPLEAHHQESGGGDRVLALVVTCLGVERPGAQEVFLFFSKGAYVCGKANLAGLVRQGEKSFGARLTAGEVYIL